ncbi:MAG: hypothetical protein ACLSHM_03170 [Vescimonas sp.]
MLKLLVKKQLTEIFRAYIYDAKKNRARSKAATVGYIIFFVLLMVGVIGGMFTVLSLTMCRSMAKAGMSWFYFAIMGLMAILLGAFGSVFTTYSSLYLPKDNDQMLSLPIPVDTLIAARLLGVYLMGLMYSGVVVLPAIIVYWATVSAAPLHLLAGVLFLLLISLFVMAISCLLGWVVAKVSLKLKNKSFVTVVLSLVFFGLYYYFFSFKATSLLTELLQNIALYGDKVRSSAYPVYLFGQAGAGDPLSMLLLTVAIAVLFGLTWLLLSRSFLSIATASGHVGRKVYRAKAVRCRSISSALLDRELRRFTSSANYMLNCGFGTLFLVLASGFLLWQGRELLELVSQSFPERSGAMPVLLAFVLCLLAVYPGSPLELLFIAVTALSYALLMALLGLFLGLKMPNLSWTNEVVPIKQSACVALSLFGGWAVAMIPGALYLLTGIGSLDPLLYLSVVTALLLILSAVLSLWVKKTGSRIFASL